MTFPLALLALLLICPRRARKPDCNIKNMILFLYDASCFHGIRTSFCVVVEAFVRVDKRASKSCHFARTRRYIDETTFLCGSARYS